MSAATAVAVCRHKCNECSSAYQCTHGSIERGGTQEVPRKIEWASSQITEPTDKPLRVKLNTDGSNRNQVLLSLPRFKNVDIFDLISLAEEKIKCRVSDRCSAIAVLIGTTSLDSPTLDIPLVLKSAPGLPKY